MKTAIVATLAGTLFASSVLAEGYSGNVIRIGVMNDQTGPISTLSGPGSVLAARMAVEDFGGNVNGVPVEIVFGDHQNKTDVGAALARKWLEADGVDAIVDLSHSGITLALAGLVKDRDQMVFSNAGAAEITGTSCNPRVVQWMYNVEATSGNVVTSEDIKGGIDTFFMITVDYALGASVSKVFHQSIEKLGGKILGEVKHPLNTTDFSSYILQAQASGAKGVLLANGAADLGNASKQAHEFGLVPDQLLMTGTMTTAEIESNGLEALQDIRSVSFYEWNRSEASKKWAEAFKARHGSLPSGVHASTYSQVSAILAGMKAAGTDGADAVIAKVREMTINDNFADNGKLRTDGRLQHDMYLVRIKKPEESQYAGDYTEILRVLSGDEAFGPIAGSACSHAK